MIYFLPGPDAALALGDADGSDDDVEGEAEDDKAKEEAEKDELILKKIHTQKEDKKILPGTMTSTPESEGGCLYHDCMNPIQSIVFQDLLQNS